MKVSLFVLLIALTSAAQAELPANFLDGLKTDAAAEQRLRNQAVAAERARAQDRAQANEYAQEAQRVADLATVATREVQSTVARAQVVRSVQRATELAVRSQAAVAPPSCPDYVVRDYSAAAPNFVSSVLANPVVTAVDFRALVPRADFEFKPTVMIDSKSGWSTKDVNDALAKVSKIYSQCGIRIGSATVVTGTYNDRIRPIDSTSESYMAYHMPNAPKPWLFFIDHRADNEFNGGAGKSIAQTSDSTRATFLGGQRFMRGTTFLAKDSLYSANGKRNGYTPELVIGHELAHILTDGDHQPGENGDPKNILADNGNNISGKITAAECAQMKLSPFVRKL